MSVIPTSHLSGRVVLVTGASGFIGSKLSEVLLELGASVHGVSRHRTDGLARTVVHHSVDVADATAAKELVKDVKPDLVFHLASHVHGAPDLRHVLPTFNSNLQTTVSLLTALADVDCGRFVTSGSLVEPEAGGERVPSSPYAAAKWASSDYARMFHALYGLPVVIARIFMVYGPGQMDETKLVPYTIRSIARGETPRMTSGRREIDWIYVDDVVAGLIALALTPGLEGESLDLGSGSLVTTAELVERICSLMGTDVRPRFGSIPDRPLEPVRAARTARTTEKTGWAPRVSLDDGLLRAIEWCTANPALVGRG
jgi:nucleoside-diphosphate-sugar epimerase